jgi:hypothetical protein
MWMLDTKEQKTSQTNAVSVFRASTVEYGDAFACLHQPCLFIFDDLEDVSPLALPANGMDQSSDCVGMYAAFTDDLSNITGRHMKFQDTRLCTLDLHTIDLVGIVDQGLYDFLYQLPHFHLLLLLEASQTHRCPETSLSTGDSIDQGCDSVNSPLLQGVISGSSFGL